MDKVIEAGFNQKWTYLTIKLVFFGAMTAAIYLEYYSGIFQEQRNYHNQW